MRKLMVAIGMAGVTALSLASSVQPSAAAVIYPWCAHYLGRGMGGAPSCGFVTYDQCMATVSGLQGTCEMNPWYEPPPPQRPRAKQRMPG
jgi:hypothetical protein